jgi:hypothetical protein
LYIFDVAALRPPFLFLALGNLTLPLYPLPFSLVSRSTSFRLPHIASYIGSPCPSPRAGRWQECVGPYIDASQAKSSELWPGNMFTSKPFTINICENRPQPLILNNLQKC